MKEFICTFDGESEHPKVDNALHVVMRRIGASQPKQMKIRKKTS